MVTVPHPPVEVAVPIEALELQNPKSVFKAAVPGQVITGGTPTVMVMLLLVAVVVVTQRWLFSMVIVQLTESLLFSVVVLNVDDEPICFVTPFTLNAYKRSVPALTGVAVNVTGLPAQLTWLPPVIAMLTDGVSSGFTVIVTVSVFAVNGLAQVALFVITQ